MKIGDKVRFLNEVGGGVVAGFQGKDIAIVRDENGFDIPMLARECVVIDTDDYNIARTRPEPEPAGAKAAPVPAALQREEWEERPVAFKPKPLERRGGEALNVMLGFVPLSPKEMSETAFEAYLINDSNYYVRFALLAQEGTAYTLRQEGLAEPNTKFFLEEFGRDALPGMERLTVQLLAYKQDKPFLLKPAMSVGLRIDGTRFYKLHTFTGSDFFEEPAFIVDVVRDDRPARTVMADAALLQEAMAGGRRPSAAQPNPARGEKRGKGGRDALVEVDLHASELLETTAGMQPKDILDYQLQVFRDTMEAHLKEKGRKIVFIHGKGDGVLRAALLKELHARYKQCSSQDASFREYGFGATLVTVR